LLFLNLTFVYSYNLVLSKKDEIISNLIKFIEIEDNKAKDPKSAIFVLDLLIALIKDLRKEISFEQLFLDEVFPKVIDMIHVLDLELLEQIFHFFSHCFKYMMPVILKNFDKFYRMYFKVLNNKNKYIKKVIIYHNHFIVCM
jgi:hypothetical protein